MPASRHAHHEPDQAQPEAPVRNPGTALEDDDQGPARRHLAPLALVAGLATVVAGALLVPASASQDVAETDAAAPASALPSTISRSNQRPALLVDPTAAASSAPAQATPRATPSTTPSAAASATASAKPRASRTATPTARASRTAKATASPRHTATSRPSRSAAPTPAALAPVVGSRYATVTVNVRSLPSTEARRIGSFTEGERVRVTALRQDGWRQVSLDGRPGWVRSAYLSLDRPRPVVKQAAASAAPSPTRTSRAATSTTRRSTAASSTSASRTSTSRTSTSSATGGGRCASTAVERGLVANAVAVHRAVCATFPSVTSFGGVRASADEHGTGHALDIMVSGDRGWQVARWARANAASLGITEVIYSQQIWTTQRAGEGWRSMSDRGSATANHFDHVHVTVR